MSQANLHRGHCRCEQIVMVANCEPHYSLFCHCDDCRRSTGAPVLAAVGFLKEHVNWESDASLARFKNGAATRLFCNNCGSPIAQEHKSLDDTIFVNTGFMDNPENYPPNAHTFSGQQLPWLNLKDDLQRVEKTLVIQTN